MPYMDDEFSVVALKVPLFKATHKFRNFYITATGCRSLLFLRVLRKCEVG